MRITMASSQVVDATASLSLSVVEGVIINLQE